MEVLTRTIDEAIRSKDYNTLSAVFSAASDNGSSDVAAQPLSWDMVGQGEKRSLAAYFIQAAVGDRTGFLPGAFRSLEHVCLRALSHLPASVDHAADNALRQQLFQYKVQHSDDYADAARILAGMRFEDDGVYAATPLTKLDAYVQIAECFLAEDQIAEADSAVNKAGAVAPLVSAAMVTQQQQQQPSSSGGSDDAAAAAAAAEEQRRAMSLLLRYKTAYARILDANRKFLQASQRYHELSQMTRGVRGVALDEDDLLQLLGRAVTCAILAPSGPQRQRTLQHLYQDARLQQLDSLQDFQSHSTILSKMYHHQVLRPDELVQFERSLADHQKAIMGDGLSIMERGVVEHNMTALSRLYRTIYLDELAHALGVSPPSRAAKVASDMILDGAIHGHIDHVERLLYFHRNGSPGEAIADAAAAPSSSLLLDNNQVITSFCMQLNTVTDAIKAATKMTRT